MVDREKVIKGLERCHSYGMCNDEGCPYYYTVGCLELLRKDALERMKEQEAKIRQLKLALICPPRNLRHK